MLTLKKITAIYVVAAIPFAFWMSGAKAAAPLYTQQPSMFKKAELMLSRGEADSAIELLGSKVDSLQRRSYRGQGHALLCRAQYQKQDFVLAEAHCDQAVELGGINWSNLNNRGVMRFLLGRYEEALSDFDRASMVMLNSTPRSKRLAVDKNIASAQKRLAESQAYADNQSVASQP